MPSRCDLILAAAFQSILFFFLIFLWFNFTSLWVANMCLLHKGSWTSCLLPSSSSSKKTCTHHGTGMENNPLCCLNANTSAFAAMRSCTQLQQQARSYSKRHSNQGYAKRRLETENSHSGACSWSYFRRLSDSCSSGIQRKKPLHWN